MHGKVIIFSYVSERAHQRGGGAGDPLAASVALDGQGTLLAKCKFPPVNMSRGNELYLFFIGSSLLMCNVLQLHKTGCSCFPSKSINLTNR